MAQVVCQVVHKPGRMSVLWSSGDRAFEPLHLEGAALAEFEATSRRGREALASSSSADLSRIGKDLYTQFFAGGVGAEIADWLRGLPDAEAFEISSDQPGRIPFALFEDPQTAGAWGRRYPLVVGRRLNPLRSFTDVTKPEVLVVIDPSIRGDIPDLSRIDLFLARPDTTLVNSRIVLLDTIAETSADVIWMLTPLRQGTWSIDGETLSPRELAEAIRGAASGNALPIVVNTPIGSPSEAEAWECHLAAATSHLPGLVSLEVPASAAEAVDVGLAFLKSFVEKRATAAAAGRSARVAVDGRGLSLAVYTPAEVRVVDEATPGGGPPVRPLPETPYQALRPLEREERAFLVGRDDDVARAALTLDQPNVAGLLIHGGAGVGKASFVRAGLLPFLEDENRGFFVIRDRGGDPANGDAADERTEPTVALRAGPDVVGTILLGIDAFASRPYRYTTPTGRTVVVDLPAIFGRSATSGRAESTAIQEPHDGASAPPPLPDAGSSGLWEAVSANPERLAELLDDVTRDLPFELVIPIEQLEDVVALNALDLHARTAQALVALARSPGRFCVVATLRTEHLGQIHALLGQDRGRGGWPDIYLPPLTDAAIKEALIAPTATSAPLYSAEVPAVEYGFGFDAGVAAEALEEVDRQAASAGISRVAAVHLVGERLTSRGRGHGSTLLKTADVRRLRKVDVANEAIESRVRSMGLTSSAVKQLRKILDKMGRDHGGVTTRNLIAWSALDEAWINAVPLDRAVAAAEEAGLLETQKYLVGGHESVRVGVPSDVLAETARREVVTPAAKRFARSRLIDALFIVIPLALLGMSLTYFITRRAVGGQAGRLPENIEREVVRRIGKAREEGALANRFALYSGFLSQANDALRQGNTLRARQLLVTQQPPLTSNDIRGFEWFELWKSINNHEALLQGHEAQPGVLAMAPGGKTLVSGDDAGNVFVWDLGDLKEPLSARLKGLGGSNDALFWKRADGAAPDPEFLKKLLGPATGIAVAADGSRVAAINGSDSVVVWDRPARGKSVVDAQPKTRLTAEGKSLRGIAFLGSDSIAVGAEDGSVAVFGLDDGKVRWTAKEHGEPVVSLVDAGDGKTLVSASPREIVIWSAEGKKQSTEPAGEGATLISLASGKSGVVALGARGGRGTVKTWSAGDAKWTPVDVDAGPNPATVGMAGEAIAIGGGDQILRVVRGDELFKVLGHVTKVRGIAGAGSRLASIGHDNAIRVWNTESIFRPGSATMDAPVASLALEPGERILASGAANGKIALWNPATGQRIGELKADGAISALTFTGREGSLALAAGVGDVVRLWDITLEKGDATGKERPPLKKHESKIAALATSADTPGKLVSASRDGTVIVWDLAKGEPAFSIKVPEPPRSLLLGTELFVGDETGVVRVFDAATGRTSLPPFRVHHGAITGMAEVPTGRRRGGASDVVIVISASEDQTIRVWGGDLRGKEYGAFQVYHAHHQPVTALGQGKGFFVTGAGDGSVKTWDPTLPDERFTYTDHDDRVRAIVVGKDNDLVVTAGDDGKIVFHRGVPRATIGPANQATPDAEAEE